MAYIGLLGQRDPNLKAKVDAFVEGIAEKLSGMITCSAERFKAAVAKATPAGEEMPSDAELEAMRRLRPGIDFNIKASNEWFLPGRL